jgi:hypothetical protein
VQESNQFERKRKDTRKELGTDTSAEAASVRLGLKSQRDNTTCRTVFLSTHFTIYRFRVVLLIGFAVLFGFSLDWASQIQRSDNIITLLPPDSNLEMVRALLSALFCSLFSALLLFSALCSLLSATITTPS